MKISRRGFILSGIAAGGGLAVAYGLSRLEDGDARLKFRATTPDQFVLHAYVKIAADGTVTIAVPQAEMGQGVTTAIPMIVAEELDADWDRVRYELAPLDKSYGTYAIAEVTRVFLNPGVVADAAHWALWRIAPLVGMTLTGGSSSIFGNYEYLRTVGAAARSMLIAAAAVALKVDARELTTERGRVLHAASGRAKTYGELAEAAAALPPPDGSAAPAPHPFTVIGQPKGRLDTPSKVDGSAGFGIDVRRPGMLYAAIRHSPQFGGTVARFNADSLKDRKGVVTAVQVGTGAVAVVAENTWLAQRAVGDLDVTFAAPPGSAFDSAAAMAENMTRFDEADISVLREDKTFATAMTGAAKTVEAIYETPYLAHVCMEPMNCTALYEPGADGRAESARITVWSPSQSTTLTAQTAARIAGVPSENVAVHATLMGGGFGRRAEMDFVREAVAIAKQLPGKPIKLTWTREQDVQQDAYRPATATRFRAGLDAQGEMVALGFSIVGKPVSADFNERNEGPFKSDPRKDSNMVMPMNASPYAFPPMRLTLNARVTPVPSGNWRSVTMSHNAFYQEAFLDEVATAAGSDPLVLRRRLLRDKPKHLAVLEAVAAKAGWSEPLTPAADGGKRGRGIVLLDPFNSVIGQVIEVTVAKDGTLKVDRVVSVIDCQIVVNPNIVIAQVESGVMDGLSAALFGRIEVKDGAVQQSNFGDYRMLTLAEAPPRLETHLLPQGGHPGGIGEVGLPGVAPALANAIFAATGQRVRKLPVALSGVVTV
jgi:isoquinoline 1-oxidoreductase beta subunit